MGEHSPSFQLTARLLYSGSDILSRMFVWEAKPTWASCLSFS